MPNNYIKEGLYRCQGDLYKVCYYLKNLFMFCMAIHKHENPIKSYAEEIVAILSRKLAKDGSRGIWINTSKNNVVIAMCLSPDVNISFALILSNSSIFLIINGVISRIVFDQSIFFNAPFTSKLYIALLNHTSLDDETFFKTLISNLTSFEYSSTPNIFGILPARNIAADLANAWKEAEPFIDLNTKGLEIGKKIRFKIYNFSIGIVIQVLNEDRYILILRPEFLLSRGNYDDQFTLGSDGRYKIITLGATLNDLKMLKMYLITYANSKKES